jgi:DNA repair protein RadA/Sms
MLPSLQKEAALMPKISDLRDANIKMLDISDLPWLKKAVGSDLEKGKAYLVPGPPGVGKSTLVHHVLGVLSRQDVKVLYLTTEQSLSDVQRTLFRIFPQPARALADNFFIDTLDDLADLPEFLNKKILTPGGEYCGCEVIAVDSLQGGGLSGQGREKYKALKAFIGCARANEITLFLINQLTKDGGIAGPMTLEHEVDHTIFIRRAHHLRLLTVTKNRFKRDLYDPVVLVMG